MKKFTYILFFALLSFGGYSQILTRFVIKNDTHKDLYIQSIDLYENANSVSYGYTDYPNNPYPNPPLLKVPSGTALYYVTDVSSQFQFPFPDQFPFQYTPQNNVWIGPGLVGVTDAILPLTDPSPNFFEYCKYYFDNWSNQDGFGRDLTGLATDLQKFVQPSNEPPKYHNGTNIQYEVKYYVEGTPFNYIVYLTWTDL